MPFYSMADTHYSNGTFSCYTTGTRQTEDCTLITVDVCPLFPNELSCRLQNCRDPSAVICRPSMFFVF